MAFGTCMAISTSAAMVGFLIIPLIMGDLEIGQDGFDSKLNLSLWLTSIVSAVCLVIFILSCIPLFAIEK